MASRSVLDEADTQRAKRGRSPLPCFDQIVPLKIEAGRLKCGDG